MSEPTARWEIAARIYSGIPRLAVAVVPRGLDLPTFAEELRADLQELMGTVVVGVTASTAHDVETAVAEGRPTVIRAESMSTPEWSGLDRARSRLAPQAAVVMILDADGATHMSAAAPSLSSWLAGSVYLADGVAPSRDAVREERLAGLRERYNMSDDQAVQVAERGDMPWEPEFAVWLVLLGRADLVRQRPP